MLQFHWAPEGEEAALHVLERTGCRGHVRGSLGRQTACEPCCETLSQWHQRLQGLPCKHVRYRMFPFNLFPTCKLDSLTGCTPPTSDGSHGREMG